MPETTIAGQLRGITTRLSRPTVEQASRRAAADAVLATRATAVIFFNDVLAIGALGRFRDLGVKVPADVSVIGCDDIFGASFSEPPLSTITVPGEAIGRVAADALITTLTATLSASTIQRFTPHLTIRESTGPAAT